jgi:hypothetical protein
MGDNMAEILKLSRETVFAPETIQILAAALDEAWERLRQSGSRLTRPAYSRAMREVVAKLIMEIARRGVEDREAAFECFKCRSGYRGSWHPTKMNAGRNCLANPWFCWDFEGCFVRLLAGESSTPFRGCLLP